MHLEYLRNILYLERCAGFICCVRAGIVSCCVHGMQWPFYRMGCRCALQSHYNNHCNNRGGLGAFAAVLATGFAVVLAAVLGAVLAAVLAAGFAMVWVLLVMVSAPMLRPGLGVCMRWGIPAHVKIIMVLCWAIQAPTIIFIGKTRSCALTLQPEQAIRFL